MEKHPSREDSTSRQNYRLPLFIARERTKEGLSIVLVSSRIP